MKIIKIRNLKFIFLLHDLPDEQLLIVSDKTKHWWWMGPGTISLNDLDKLLGTKTKKIEKHNKQNCLSNFLLN